MQSSIDFTKKFESDLAVAIDLIIAEMDFSPDAIILCGGYGRNEGGWLIIDGKICAYNDYDFAIITNHPVSRDRTNQLRKRIASAVGIKWVDIDYYSVDKLHHLTSTIHNYDLLYGSKVIYGNPNILKGIKSIQSHKIGKKDVLILYKTRMWTFLGSWDGDFCDLNEEKGCFFKNQMAKAILAACDMILIKQKKYDVSYRKRADLCKQLFCDDPKTIALIEFAIKEKLEPSYKSISKEEMLCLYSSAKSFFTNAFQYSFETRAIWYLNPSKTFIAEKVGLSAIIMFIKSIVRKKTVITRKSSDIFLAQNYVFNMMCSEIKQKYIEKINKILFKWGYLKNKENNVFKLKNIVAQARNNI